MNTKIISAIVLVLIVSAGALGIVSVVTQSNADQLAPSAACSSPQRCSEIDQVWLQIAFNINPDKATQIYEPAESVWKTPPTIEEEEEHILIVEEEPQVAPTVTLESNRGPYVVAKRKLYCLASEGTPEMRALLDAIAWAEGTGDDGPDGYKVMFGHSSTYPRLQQDLSQHPAGTSEMPLQGFSYGSSSSTAAGRYQFLKNTYDGLKSKGYFKTGFNAMEQDKAGLHLVQDKRKISQGELELAIKYNDFIPVLDKLSKEWASLPYSQTNCKKAGCGNGKSYYGQGGKPAEQIVQAFNVCYNVYKGAATSLPPTGSTQPAGSFRFVVMSDTNGGETAAGNTKQPGAVGKAVQAITAMSPKPAFVIMDGDMIASGPLANQYAANVPAMWDEFLKTVVRPIQKENIGFFPAAGNHDVSFERAILEPEYGRVWRNYQQFGIDNFYGQYDKYYSFDYLGWHFIVLYAAGNVFVEADQLAFLEDQLKAFPGKNTFVFGHVQLRQLATCPNKEGDPCRGGLQKVADVLRKYPQVRAYFHGHQQVYYKGVLTPEGINVVSTGRLGAGAFTLLGGGGTQDEAFVVVDVSGNQFTVSAREGPDFQHNFDESTFPSLQIPGYRKSQTLPDLGATASVIRPIGQFQPAITSKTVHENAPQEKVEQTICFRNKFGVSDEKSVKLETVNVGGTQFKVNKVMAEPLRKVAEVMNKVNYKVYSGNSCRGGQPECGGFHPSCLAIDINPQQNPFCPSVADSARWWGRVPSNEERERCRRGEIVTEIPVEVINAFEDNGFYWGGRYGSVKGPTTPDSMHFEYVGDDNSCCKRQFTPVTYSVTSEDSYKSNPPCYYGTTNGICKPPS
ncbi:metallophosphoesterase [Candidatus Woesearchaeota archaeon]|nr:metallophosphoesterase [Candidatus Woesearchaeota archaeon]